MAKKKLQKIAKAKAKKRVEGVKLLQPRSSSSKRKSEKIEIKKNIVSDTREDGFKSRKIKVKVVGLGGGGSAVASEVSSLLKTYSFIACDTDIRTAKKIKKGVKFFQFGQSVLDGTGTGMNAELAQKIAIEEKERIEQIFQGQDVCILVGCLGGGVASGAGPIFAQAAKNQKCLSIGIFTLPFLFEGEKKMKVAKKAIAELKENLSGIIVVSNEKIFQLTDKKISLKKALSYLNQFFALWLMELLDVVFKPSLINIDFADLKAILKDRGHTLFFSQAQGAGSNRVEDILKNIFHNNLLSEPPKNVKRALFNISGGKDLKLKEVEQISEEIANLNPKAKIIFGVTQIPQQKEKVKVVLLAVCEDDKKQKIVEEKPGTVLEKNIKKLTEKNKAKKKDSQKQKLGNGLKIIINKGEAIKKDALGEKTRRSGVESQKAEEDADKVEWANETDWDIPAFLRDNFKK